MIKYETHAAIVAGVAIVAGLSADHLFGGLIALGGLLYGLWGAIRKDKYEYTKKYIGKKS